MFSLKNTINNERSEDLNKIIDKIYVGTVEDFKLYKGFPNISFLGACKDPLHKIYAKLDNSDTAGYIGRAMPKDQQEYLYAERPHALYCNLIDGDNTSYIPKKTIDKALRFIYNEIQEGRDILIICNQAVSRSPSIAFMYLMEHKFFNFNKSFKEVKDEFIKMCYPKYRPSRGFDEYVEKFWNDLKEG